MKLTEWQGQILFQVLRDSIGINLQPDLFSTSRKERIELHGQILRQMGDELVDLEPSTQPPKE